MNSLEEYAALFERLALTELTVEEGDRKLCLKKEAAPIIRPEPAAIYKTAAPVVSAPQATSDTVPAAAEPISEQPKPTRTGEVVRSPLLGVFYARVGGEVRSIGEQVRKGDVLCTIEAMKMMNEVVSPADGVITEILAADGALVEYNQELFVIG